MPLHAPGDVCVYVGEAVDSASASGGGSTRCHCCTWSTVLPTISS